MTETLLKDSRTASWRQLVYKLLYKCEKVLFIEVATVIFPIRKELFFVLILLGLFSSLPGSISFGGETQKVYYSIYATLYKNLDDANAAVNLLKAQGFESFSIAVNIPKKGRWHRVFVGSYKSRGKALNIGKRLREKGIIKSFIIRKTNPENKTGMPHNYAKNNGNRPSSPPFSKGGNILNPTFAKGKNPPIPPLVKGGKECLSADSRNVKKGAPLHKAASKELPNLQGIEKKHTKPSLYGSAMGDFKSGRYEDALNKFKKIIRINILKAEQEETVLRCMADCYFFLKDFPRAIDQYRNLIRNYPCSKKENALALYRLARSYENLKLYYEALREFESLYSRYPESHYIPESVFIMGKMYYRTGKFDKTIEKFKEYIKRFPDGEHVKDAYFGIGDCYSRMRQFGDADIWYGKALKKWPDLEEIPKDILLKLGSHYFQIEKYDQALKIFFVYVNLFPEDEHCKGALYMIARSLTKMGQFPLALEMLSSVIERYPESKEAGESAIIMANIGVKNPKMKLPVYIFSGMDHYQDPIKTYDEMIKRFSDLEMKEELLFRKGNAFLESGRYRKAFDFYCSILKRFPSGTYRKASEKNLILSASYLVDDYCSKRDYISVSQIYFKSSKNGLFEFGDFDMLFKIGASLENIDLSDSAVTVFKEMINIFKGDEKINRLLIAIAEIDYNMGSYKNAEKRLERLLKKQPVADKKIWISARKLMGDIYYRKGLFEKAACFYSEVLGSGEDVEGMAVVYKGYADSLKEMGLYSAALINYRRATEACNGAIPVVPGSYKGLGDCFYNEGEYKQAISMYEQSMDYIPEGKQDLWTTFNIGRGYTNLGNRSMADKSFSLLKGENTDEFWSSVVDYCISDKNWAERYGRP